MKLIRSDANHPQDPFQKFSSGELINRELSWLEFNVRVLEEANNPNHPLLERLRFLAISDSNLDEFYMVRVAGLKNHLEIHPHSISSDGLSIVEQLSAINHKTRELLEAQSRTWQRLSRELLAHGISIVKTENLNKRELKWLDRFFMEQIFPVLTPLAVDPAHPFPLIPNDGLCFVLKLKTPQQKAMWSLVPLPKNLQRFVPVMGEKKRFLAIEDIIATFFPALFPEFEVQRFGLFHLIRDSEMDIDEDSEDLIEMFKTALQQRRQGNVIRLIVNDGMPDDLIEFVMDELEIESQDVFHVSGLLNLDTLNELILPEFAHLQFPSFTPKVSSAFHEESSCFDAIRKSDIMLHHPYESFNSVIDFLTQSARDPNVLAIKQTLYRTSVDSPIVKALVEAANMGKSVTVVVELKARFDEEENIRMAEILENAGVHVIFGFIDFKIHCKMTLVVRKEANKRIRNYLHVGTGNYNPRTAKVYTDISVFTANSELCMDAAKVFNYLTGYAKPHQLEKLIISPLQMQEKLLQMIRQEIRLCQETGVGRIWAKMNSLVDPDIIHALYEASQAGVQIDLVVRGICCLRPGIPELSENIRVKSMVGRFLEHSRIVCFGLGHEIPSEMSEVFISSADWMPRNFHSRVETLIPITDPQLKKELLEKIMSANLKDVRQSWVLQPNGTYERISTSHDAFSAQEYFMHLTSTPPTGDLSDPTRTKPKANKKLKSA